VGLFCNNGDEFYGTYDVRVWWATFVTSVMNFPVTQRHKLVDSLQPSVAQS
jgi:hypothetical protein